MRGFCDCKKLKGSILNEDLQPCAIHIKKVRHVFVERIFVSNLILDRQPNNHWPLSPLLHISLTAMSFPRDMARFSMSSFSFVSACIRACVSTSIDCLLSTCCFNLALAPKPKKHGDSLRTFVTQCKRFRGKPAFIQQSLS